jgi:hypothetical protein
MSETPEKKKAHLRYDNVFKTAWTAEFHFTKHVYKNVCKGLACMRLSTVFDN